MEKPGGMKRTTVRNGWERDPPRENEKTGNDGKGWTCEGRASQARLLCRINQGQSDIVNRRGALAREETRRMEQRTARDGRGRDPPREHERTGDEGRDRTWEDRASQSKQLCRINRTHTGGQNER